MTAGDLTARLRASNDDLPPPALLAAARAAYSWRTLDADLCRPAYDSLLDDGLVPVRGGGDARLLRFAADRLAVDLEVSVDAAGRAVVGQLTPPMAGEVTLRHGGAEETTVPTDDAGRFAADGLRPGPFSLRCVVAEEAALHTDWVLI